MASFHGSAALSQLKLRTTLAASVKKSPAFYGNTRDFGKIYRGVPSTTTWKGVVRPTRHGGIVPASSSSEDAQQEYPPWQSSSSEDAQQEYPPWQQQSEASWVERYLPTSAWPYARLARLHKPDAIWLYAWPSIWSIAVAANKGEFPDIKMIALFGLGSVFLRCASCAANDLLDRDIDKKVERTKSRPLATGALTPTQGFYFLVFSVLLWFGFLLQLNNHSLIIGASWLILAFSYPLMKRFINWPQAFLGFTASYGVILGASSIKENFDYAVLLPMFFAVLFWTLVYDTIYAHQDKKDDFKAGVKSTAITFGDNTKYWLSGFAAVCISSLVLTGYNAHLAWPYYPFLVAAAGHIAWQVLAVDLSDKSDCNRKFVSNKWFGALIFGGFLCGNLIS